INYNVVECLLHKSRQVMLNSKKRQEYYQALINKNSSYDFTKIMGAAPTRTHHLILKAAWLDTKLGPMIAIADEDGLYLLEFVDRRGLENEVQRLRKKLKAAIIPGETPIIKSIESEITHYFNRTNYIFKTPIHPIGSLFQKRVWEELRKIPLGETRSYLDIAKSLKKPTA